MRHNFDLTGRVALITGGAGILGREMTRSLADCGAQVVVVDRDRERIDATLADVTGKVDGAVCDIADRAALEQLCDKIERDFGPVDILLNNAATKSENFFEPFESYSEEDWDYVMNVNVNGARNGCQVFGRRMAERGRGSIINTLSIYGIMAPDQRIYEGSFYEGRSINTPAIYSVSKAALWGLTRYLASYWADRGVRVNAVTPGGAYSGQNDIFVQNYSARIPMGRMAQPAELGGAVVYLASDASSYVTGHNLVVDGGLNIW